jgi:hypothetical protein
MGFPVNVLGRRVAMFDTRLVQQFNLLEQVEPTYASREL